MVAHVPARGRAEVEQRARARSSELPLADAVALARRDIERARSLSDPRYLGHAAATLAPWWAMAEPPPDVLLLRATVNQSLHDFSAARRDLDLLVQRRPTDVEAHLVRAVVTTVTGDYAAARESCAALELAATTLIAVACRAPLDALAGDPTQSYARLADALRGSRSHDLALGMWVETLLAEIAIQSGDLNVAESHLRRVLARDATDVYARALLADVLLMTGRAAEASEELAGHEAADALLLRRTIAEHRANGSEARALVAQMAARFAAARLRGDQVHLREEARFALEVQNDVRRATELAAANWRVQKELADARLLADAAAAAGSPAAADPVREWARTTGVVDARLTVALAGMGVQ